jgi:8-oxo-dGTP diphosphatase
MELKDLIIARSEEAYKLYLPHLSIDCVVFGFHEASLRVLLLKVKGMDTWALPGGYVGREEELEQAATRILNERTGAENIYLQQFRLFSKPGRSEAFFKDYPEGQWHRQRFVSAGFYALVNYTQVAARADEYTELCEWRDINDIPEMIMDHRAIFDAALIKLRRELNYKPIGCNLLPEIFTMPELQKLYEILLGKPLNRGNFYRKMMAYDILDKLDETRKGGAHKAPNLYRFNTERYTIALQDGLKEGW